MVYGIHIPRSNGGGPIHTNRAEVQKDFFLADGHPTPATNIAKLEHRLQEPERTVNVVLELANQSLLSVGKFSEASYVPVCDGDEVNIYGGRNVTITESEEDVLKGWRFPCTKLWGNPFRSQVTDLNMHTLLLNGSTGYKSINSLYTFPTSALVLACIERFNTDHAAGESINNFYGLPILERAVRYLHTAEGFPTKSN